MGQAICGETIQQSACSENMKQALERVVAECRLEEVFFRPIGQLSKGFRQRLSFAQALPMYMESVGEYFILELTRDVNFASFIEGFNAHGYSGIVARGAREMPKEEGNPMNLVRAASYRYEMAGDEAAIKAAIESMMAKEEIIYYKKGKGGLKELNLRARLYELGYENGIVTMLVGCGETNLSPYEVINRLYESIGSEKRVENKDILRTQMYYEDETEGFLPFL